MSPGVISRPATARPIRVQLTGCCRTQSANRILPPLTVHGRLHNEGRPVLFPQHRPPIRQIVDRHIIIGRARPVAAARAALDDAERGGPDKDGRAAVAAPAIGAGHTHPGRLAGAAAQIARGREIGQLHLGAAIAGLLAAVAHHVAGAGGGAGAQARHRAHQALDGVGIE